MAQDRDADTDMSSATLPASPSAGDSSSNVTTNTSAAPASGQSKRPGLGGHKESDSHSDTTASTQGAGATRPHHRRQHTGQKHQHHQHHVGKLSSRVTSSKALHKQGGQQTQQLPPGAKLTRRITSPTGSHLNLGQRQQSQSAFNNHRRANSEAKIPKNISGTKLPKSSSHTSLQRNQSAGNVVKASKSTEKLKRASSGTGLSRQNHRPKSSKSSVHFALGDDDDEVDASDEWVDASGSNSPYLSRKGSFNSTVQSPLRRSADNSRPESPNEHRKKPQDIEGPSLEPSTADRERSQHKEYITSRLLQRVPSSGAPPKMTADVARATPRNSSPESTSDRGATVAHASSSGRDELTSRFVDTPASGVASQSSFYPTPGSASGPRSGLDHDAVATSVRSDGLPTRPHSMANLSNSRDTSDDFRHAREPENSALVPRAGRRSGQAAETSRIQQKLNLQRASSVIEPGQGPVGVQGAERSTPVIGIGGPGYDGGHSRDPRVGKLLERTGMEYLVVRRYQNPVARSLSRLSYLSGTSQSGSNSLLDMKLTLPRTTSSSSTTNGRRSADTPGKQHARNVSMPNPDFRRPVTPTATASASASRRATPKGSINGSNTLDGGGVDGEGRAGGDKLSESDLTEEEDATAILLRHMWEKSQELSASQD